jgi:hypothetical protein
METGKEIGRGLWRIVYEHPNDSTLVIKKLSPNLAKLNESDCKKAADGHNPNLREWQLWQKYKDTDYRLVLCPCVCISEDYQFLVMKKALKSVQIWAWKLPRGEIKDYKHFKNWGIYENRAVIIDYGD